AVTPVVPQAVHPHEIWQVDAVEDVPLATGQRICWLTVTDEVSGAILATEVSPPPQVGTGPPARDPGDVPPGLRGLGPARPRAGRQRLSLGHVPRPASRAGVVVDRAGRGSDLESRGPAHLQSQSGAVQRPAPAMGRAAPLRRLRRGGRGAGRGRPDPAPGVSRDPRSHPDGGVPPTEHGASRLSAGPRNRGGGGLPPPPPPCPRGRGGGGGGVLRGAP